MKTLRAFIAVEISEPLKVSLRKIQDSFRNKRDRVGWVKPAGMHLTLKFLGEIEEEMIPSIGERISRACAVQGPFSLHLIGADVFPDFKRPRVLWVGVGEGGEQLRGIFRTLDPLLETIGFSREKRSFHPHVTLGRLKALHDRRRFMAHVAENREVNVGTMTVEAVHLIESRLRPDGAEYQIRFTSSLDALR